MTMPKRYFPQQATWWAKNAVDSYGGSLYSSPITVNVRWENKNELFRNRLGDEEVSNAIVYVDRDIEIGDYLLLGISTSNDPSLTDAKEVKAFNKTPDLRTLQNLRKAIL